MGYTTYFTGEVTITPPLNEYEIAYLNSFADSRRMDRRKGPYHVEPGNDFARGSNADVRDFNMPPHGQPGLWCKWVPTDDGGAIEWSGAEKFYDSPEWMKYLIDTFLKPGAAVQQEMRTLQGNAALMRLPASGWTYPEEFKHFTFDHVCNGEIDADGEASDDRWRLVVRDNVVSVQNGSFVYSDESVVGEGSPATIRVTATRADQPDEDLPALTTGQRALPAAVDLLD